MVAFFYYKEDIKMFAESWATDPDGLQYYLELMYDRYDIPMMVVENGLGAVNEISEDGKIHDEYRIDYLRMH